MCVCVCVCVRVCVCMCESVNMTLYMCMFTCVYFLGVRPVCTSPSASQSHHVGDDMVGIPGDLASVWLYLFRTASIYLSYDIV